MQQKEAKTKTKKAVLNHPLRILIMNCQSIKNKKAEIHTVIDSAKPDIILGNESWLTPEVKNSEIFSDSFDAIWKDRAGDSQGGGVFIAYRRDLLCTETPELDAKCEVVWCKLNIIGCRTLYLGSVYCPPICIEEDTSRQRSGKGAIRKRFPLQKPRREKTKPTIRYLYHETYRKPNEQLFSQ